MALWLIIKRSRKNDFEASAFLYSISMFRSKVGQSIDSGNLRVKHKIRVLFSSYFISLPYFLSVLPSLFLHASFLFLLDCVCGLNIPKKKYETASKVIFVDSNCLTFSSDSNFPIGKIVIFGGNHSPSCVSDVIKSSELLD